MFQARSEWRHIRLIFDHAEGLLIRFTYSFSWVLSSNYHNCCAKHARLYVFLWDARVCHEMEIPVPNPINAGWMAGHAEEEGGYWYEGKRKGREVGGDNGRANDSPEQSAHPPGAPQDICQQVSLWHILSFIIILNQKIYFRKNIESPCPLSVVSSVYVKKYSL